MDRRSFLAGAAAAAFGQAAPSSEPAIDTHMHLFDPERPQGVPWPSKRDPVLYRPALPARYREVSAPFSIAGAIAVECSPWLEDNQWLLDTAAQDPIFVAVVGNLEIGAPDFRPNLERFSKNPLFRGLRYGNLWGRNLSEVLSRKQFIEDMRFLAGAGLSLDTADPDPALLSASVRLSDLVPELRLILDHLPGADPPSEPSARKLWYANLRELAPRPQVYVKVSHLLRRVQGKVPADLAFYRERVDEMWEFFGPDRLLFGSDWPNCDQWGPYSLVYRLVREYFDSKGRQPAEKYFWKNSLAAYRWRPRTAAQSSLAAAA